MAGRGWGKTRTGAEDVGDYAIWNDNVRVAVVAPTYSDARDTCVEGESGLLATIPHECIDEWNRSLGELKLWNGSRFKLFSAEEPSRLRGPQFHRAWCDEIAAWERPETYDQLMFGLRLGVDPRVIATTTPKNVQLIKALYKRRGKDVFLTGGRTMENSTNLARAALDNLLERYGGTRLGRQELDAELLEDMEGALWQRARLDELRLNVAPPLSRVCIAVDPAVSTNEGSDETGIIAAGTCTKKKLYVLGDYSGKYSPNEWAQLAVRKFHEHKADFIIAEANNGGDLVEANIKTVDGNVPVKLVHASRGKFVRAEPVASLAEQGRHHHVGSFPKLEDQMCGFTIDFDRKKAGFSPDRMDAMVWAGHELILLGFPGSGLLDYLNDKEAKALAEAEAQKNSLQRATSHPNGAST